MNDLVSGVNLQLQEELNFCEVSIGTITLLVVISYEIYYHTDN